MTTVGNGVTTVVLTVTGRAPLDLRWALSADGAPLPIPQRGDLFEYAGRRYIITGRTITANTDPWEGYAAHVTVPHRIELRAEDISE